MRLGIDIRSLSEPSPTGITRYTKNMISAIAALKHRHLSRVCLLHSGHRRFNRALFQSEQYNGFIEFIDYQIPNKVLNAAYAASLSRFLLKSYANIDYLWMPNLNFFDTNIEIPFAITVHDISFIRRPSYYTYRSRLWHTAIRFRNLLRRADKVIAVSNYTASDLRDLKLLDDEHKEKLRVIYPGVKKSASTVSSKRSNILLFVGTIERRKNIDALQRAFKLIRLQFPELQLVIVGKNSSVRSPDLQLISTDSGISYRGYVSDEEMDFLYAQSRLFIWPSLYEGFGFPPLEALSHGTPILTSYRTSLPEVLQNNAHFVNPYNYRELAAVAIEMLQSQLNVREVNRNYVDTFSFERSALNLIDFILT